MVTVTLRKGSFKVSDFVMERFSDNAAYVESIEVEEPPEGSELEGSLVAEEGGFVQVSVRGSGSNKGELFHMNLSVGEALMLSRQLALGVRGLNTGRKYDSRLEDKKPSDNQG